MATHALPSSRIIASTTTRPPPRRCAPSRPSLLRRLYIAFLVSQMRRAQREIDRILGPRRSHRAHRAELPPQR